MGHFAKVENGIVTAVIAAEQEFFDTVIGGNRWGFADDTPGEWIETSARMRGGKYIDKATNQPAADQSVISGDEARERKNYAAIGDSYDETRNAFINQKPFPSWTLNETTCLWDAPKPRPDNDHYWDEDTQAWIEYPF